jgi:predicted RNA-binding Zn ribbon-like protein
VSTPDAPGAAALVEDFCNTVEYDDAAVHETLTGPPALTAWLVARGLVDAGTHADEADLRAALALREQLRGLLEAMAHDDIALDRTAAGLDLLAAELPLRLTFAGGVPALLPAVPGVRGGLAAVLAGAATAVGEGTWERLKVCSRSSCRCVFYDASRNRSRHWCSMSVCGNKAKTQSYRQRRREEQRPDSTEEVTG